MKILSFDVESNGLHGQGFAIGAVVTDEDGIVAEFTARCPIIEPVDPWVAENVLSVLGDIQETHDSYGDMLEGFYAFLQEYSNDAKIMTFIPWPVETRVLSDVFSLYPDRWFQGPFPVIDLATALDTLGHTATSDDEYVQKFDLQIGYDGSSHHPLYDAYVAETIYRHLMESVRRSA